MSEENKNTQLKPAGDLESKTVFHNLRLAATLFKNFTEERVRGVLANLEEIDSLLGSLLENWDVYRLGAVERSVLRMGLWELIHTDVPAPVVINEAIDLANWFSSPKSRAIINGVLDKFAKRSKGAEE